LTLDLSRPSTLKELMAAHRFRPLHRLGQNFLVDSRVLDRIVAELEAGPGDLVLEIGPGLGTLTQRLAQAAGDVLTVEVDGRAVDLLRQVLLPQAPNVELVHGDAMRLDLRTLLAERLRPGARARVAANLPYYITTPLLMRLLEEELPLSRLVVMVQKEVADRMVAPPGSKEYGALSVAVQYFTEARLALRVSRGAFLPAPEVDSALVALTVRKAPPVEAPRSAFFTVVKAAFGQRRKTLANALAGGLGRERSEVDAILSAAGVDGSRRGETLGVAEFAAIARGLV
jgi:16S rRNA (adenine1518-N6/adenine1519-N6)-dimethyltransferase